MDAFVHEGIFESVEGSVVVQDGAVNHEVMWLVVATVNDERFENMDELLECSCAVWCVECCNVLLPLCFNEVLPIVHNVIREVVMLGPPCTRVYVLCM